MKDKSIVLFVIKTLIFSRESSILEEATYLIIFLVLTMVYS